MVFEDTHTIDDERDLLEIELAEEEWDQHFANVLDILAKSADLLAEECAWRDSVECLDLGLTPEERAQALGLRLVLA